ncbi:hypothetical protein LIER_28842 [Lithospermum erythrorhizon]|uniref:Uncharacterized protein n=1 Tax=Lithospermum erythrorhizon TaxID=34254 RepID=A0AAV3RJ08_LITER
MYFDDMLPYSFTLSQQCSNNMAEYQGLILGFEFVINQLTGEYEVRKPELVPYHGYASRLLQAIDKDFIKLVPGKMNKHENALAALTSSIAYLGKEIRVLVCEKWVTPPIFELQEYETKDEEEAMVTTTVDGAPDDWRLPFIDYFQHGRLPDDLSQNVDIRRRAPRFLYYACQMPKRLRL